MQMFTTLLRKSKLSDLIQENYTKFCIPRVGLGIYCIEDILHDLGGVYKFFSLLCETI
jgi:hypothetical protein